MKKLNLNLSGIKEMLTKEQMKKVVGGDYGDCCAHTDGWTSYQCGYSSASEAEAAATAVALRYGVRAFWCCDSCSH